VPKVWLGVSLIAFVGASVWLGMDLHHFIGQRGSSEKALMRLLYLLFSHTDVPVVQFVVATALAALASKRICESTHSSKDSERFSANRSA
jgi:hypothetical protein